ncbi:tyrosine-type recombinase/integrase [Rhizobium leguminosarum]|nr:tyrosine-type recombinase/integrase [Rhizobium leguminosarum]
MTHTHSAPTVKQRLAAVRHLFDWLVIGHVMETNPAHSVRGPAHSRRRGKTPVLAPEEARQLLDRIPTDTLIGKRDRALIGLMTYTFARIGAATGMEIRGVYAQNRRLWVRLHEKGGKQVELPCHHSLEAYLDEYIDAAGLKDTPRAPLFQTIRRGAGRLSGNALPQANAYAMVQRQTIAAGITTAVCNHTFRATGITRTGQTYPVDLLRAAHRLAGPAIHALRPRDDRCRWQRLVDGRHQHHRDPAGQRQRLGAAVFQTAYPFL